MTTVQWWVPAQKHWLIDLGWADELVEVLQDAGYRVIGFEVQQAYDDWAVGLFQAVGSDRAPAVHRALSTVLHPDKSTGSAELQPQLNDGRRQVEERQADMQRPQFENNDPPGTEYSGGPDEDWIYANASEGLRSFAKKYNVPIDVVVKRSQTPEGFGVLINECRAGTYRAPAEERRSIQPRTERRNISGCEARRITEACYPPGSALRCAHLMTLADKRRMLEAMRTPTARRRLSGRQAALALMSRYPWAVYP